MTSVPYGGVSAAGVLSDRGDGGKAREGPADKEANCRQKVDRMMLHKNLKFRAQLIAVAIGFSVLASGCATKPNPSDEAAVQAYNEANDPLEPMNRYFFEVNQFLDEILLKPLAGWYHTALPQPAEDGVRN